MRIIIAGSREFKGGEVKMKPTIKFMLSIIVLIMMFIVIIALAILRFKNPDMTSTRLFMTFWREYLFSIFMVYGGYFTVKKINKM